MQCFDAQSGDLLFTERRNEERRINGIVFRPDSKQLALIINGGMSYVVDAEDGQNKYELGWDIRRVFFTPDSSYVTTDGQLKLMHTQHEQINQWLYNYAGQNFRAISELANDIVFSPLGGKLIYTRHGSTFSREIEALENVESEQILEANTTYEILHFSTNGSFFATVSEQNQYVVKIWDAKNFEPFSETVYTNKVVKVVISPDSSKIVSVLNNGRAIVTEMTNNTPLFGIDDIKSASIQFANHGENLVTLHKDKFSVWNSTTGENVINVDGEFNYAIGNPVNQSVLIGIPKNYKTLVHDGLMTTVGTSAAIWSPQPL